jgi:hypothetical protein
MAEKLNKTDFKNSKIIFLSEEEKLKRSDKLWKKLVKELDSLKDNNYTAKKLFNYIERNYA